MELEPYHLRCNTEDHFCLRRAALKKIHLQLHRPRRVYRHRPGDPCQRDNLSEEQEHRCHKSKNKSANALLSNCVWKNAHGCWISYETTPAGGTRSGTGPSPSSSDARAFGFALRSRRNLCASSDSARALPSGFT